MELLLKINDFALVLAFVCFNIMVTLALRTRGPKPSKKVQIVVNASMLLVAIWRMVLEFLNGNIKICIAMLLLVAIIVLIILFYSWINNKVPDNE